MCLVSPSPDFIVYPFCSFLGLGRERYLVVHSEEGDWEGNVDCFSDYIQSLLFLASPEPIPPRYIHHCTCSTPCPQYLVPKVLQFLVLCGLRYTAFGLILLQQPFLVC